MKHYCSYLVGGFLLGSVIHTNVMGESHSANLSVSVSGLGSVTSDPPGIACPGTCFAAFPAFSDVELRAKPDKGQRFLGWEGDCDSPEQHCRLYMDSEKIVQINFSADFQ